MQAGQIEERPWAPVVGGVQLAVRLTPRARKEGLDGLVRDAAGRPLLQIRLAAPPVEGAANAALIALLARALGLRKAEVQLRSGTTSRMKILFLAGEPAVLTARLGAWLDRGGG
ncbi:DUF167 family protein [Acidisoma sp. 7E03]